MHYEKDLWQPGSKNGQRHLNAATEVLPDAKLVENSHQKLRNTERAMNANSTLSKSSLMLSCVLGGVLEERGMNTVEVSAWELAQTGVGGKNARFQRSLKTNVNSGRHKTSPQLELLMNPATPAAPTPQGLVRSAAATSWFFHHGAQNLQKEKKSHCLQPGRLLS